MVVALVLGSTAERNFHQTMMMGDGNPSIFFTRTVCRVLIALLCVLLVSPWIRGFTNSRRARILATQGSSR